MKKSSFWIMLAAVTLVFAMTWSVGGANKEPYKIGAIFDYSGRASTLGLPEKETAEMLEKQINDKGGINGHPVKIIIKDNRSDPTECVKVTKELIEQDKVAVIVGPSTTGTSMAIINTIDKAQIPLISAAAAKSIIAPVAERKWIFKTPQNDEVVATKIIEYLLKNKMTKVAFLYEDNPFGQGGLKEFKEVAAKKGVNVVVEEKYGATDADMTPQVIKVKNSAAQACVVWSIPPAASTVTKNYRQLGVTIPLIQSHGVGNKAYIEQSGAASEGVIFPIGRLLIAEQLPDNHPQKKVLVQYAKDYETQYKKPRSTFGGHGWDAVMLAVEAMKKGGDNPAKIRDELEKIKKFVGIGGIFNFSPTDHNGLDVDALVMVKIEKGKWVWLK
jgi:branched-chain amino acid transport system substrate-binding protein